MGPSQQKLEELWKRIEEARLQVHRARAAIRKVNRDRGGIPFADSNYAFTQALRDEMLAVGKYFRALGQYRTSLTSSPEVAVDSGQAESALTAREQEVLALIASGRSSKGIATQLGISFKTAVCHRYRIQTKLKAHNTADLTRAALRMGLIEL